MARQLENPAGTPVAAAIDHYSDWCIYSLVAAGFITLAGTGGLDWLTMGAMSCALALRVYFLWTRRTVRISESLTTLLTIGYFGFFAADYFVISKGFLPATVHLAVFAVIIRMFSLRRQRDYITLAVLAFLMVLAAAILTVDTLFLLSFAAFLLIAVATFVLFEIRHCLASQELQAQSSSFSASLSALPVSIARVALGLMLMILATSAVLFVILPRRSAGYLSAYSFGTDLSSGFSDHVRLGQIGRIQQSDAVVMHIEIEGDRSGRYDLYWRGVALSDFDGQVWSKPRQEFLLRPSPEDESFVIPNSEAANAGGVRNFAPKFIHYRVLMEPIGTNVFFLAPQVRSVSGNYHLLATDLAGDVYHFDSQHAISRYEADSDISKPAGNELRQASGDYPREITQTYLRLPPMDIRVRQLAQQITGAEGTEFDKAAVLERYLRANYQYTLDLPKTATADPIADFLFERKQGHCEYFASAMAVMLRSVGIPSRVVNGFRSDEFNDLTGNYVVRAKDAHAWVEAFFPGYGWQTFDPTPVGAVGTPQGWARIALYFDAAASLWREWVVSYDVSHQYVLGQTAINETRNLLDRARVWTRTRYESIVDWGKQVHHRAERSPLEWIIAALVASLAFVILRNWGWIGRFVREHRLGAHPERNPEQAATIWYRRMTRTLGQSGTQKPETLTPREFLEKIGNTNLREPVARFTESYESARFGNSAEEAARLPELYQAVETAARQR
jgi:transglutaminase-like putative cysteine protease